MIAAFNSCMCLATQAWLKSAAGRISNEGSCLVNLLRIEKRKNHPTLPNSVFRMRKAPSVPRLAGELKGVANATLSDLTLP